MNIYFKKTSVSKLLIVFLLGFISFNVSSVTAFAEDGEHITSTKNIVIDGPRIKENFNLGWKFHKGDVKGAHTPNFNDASWENTVLPHTLEETDYMANTWYRGIGWYRKSFDLTEADSDKNINIYFEGVKTVAEVWINGMKLDTHTGGFDPFDYDLTEHLNFNEENIISVKVDNSYQENVAPEKPDGSYIGFNMFGGIYRDVHLIKTEKVYIPESIHSWNDEWSEQGGVFVTSEVDVAGKSADVQVKTWVKNITRETKTTTVVSNIINKLGEIVGINESELEIKPNEVKEYINTIQVSNPALWDIKNPNLYDVMTEVKVNGEVVDNYKTEFGIRKTEFTKDKGFFLNDEHVKILGVNHHQDWPYIGDAAPNNMQYYDVKKIRDSGSNFVRDAHYLYDDAFMEAADELGVMQWVEVPGWGNVNPNEFGSEWRESNIDILIATIRTARNHPSVVIWGAGINEMQQDVPLETRMNDIAHEEDPSRPTSMGRNYNTDNNVFDVYGRNIYTESEWEAAGLKDGAPDPDSQGLIITEHTGHTYETWRDTDEKQLIEHAFRIEKMTQLGRDADYVHGSIVWEMHDHHHEISVVRPHGLTDAGRIPKFAYYWHQSQSSENNYDGSVDPMVFIANYLMPDSPKDITVFSNADKVKLSMWENGNWKEFTTNKPEDINVAHPHYKFDLKNIDPLKLKAEGFIDGEKVSEHIVEKPEEPSKINLNTDIKKIDANGSDISLVEFYIKDKNGTVVPYSDNQVDFEVSGPGEIVGDASPSAVNGANILLVKSTGTPGIIEVKARSKGLNSSEITIEANDVGIDLPQVQLSIEVPKQVNGTDKFEVLGTFKNNGKKDMTDIELSLNLPRGWTVESESETTFSEVGNGEEVEVRFNVLIPDNGQVGKHDINLQTNFKLNDTNYSDSLRESLTVIPTIVNGAKWLSNLDWSFEENGWGPVERDMSNGEDKSGDGTTIRMNGFSYQKGLGVHANSKVIYDIDKEYSRFTSEIGIDDEVGQQAVKVIYEVFGDDEKLYEEIIHNNQEPVAIDLDIKNISELKLVVRDAGNGIGSAHANWGGAKLIGSEGESDTMAPTIKTLINDEEIVEKAIFDETETIKVDWEALDDETGLSAVDATFNGKSLLVGTSIDLEGKVGEHTLVVKAVDKVGNVSIETYKIIVESTTVNTNIALNKPATASSEQDDQHGNHLAINANNANPSTRWAAEDGKLPQWWQVDLETVQEINQVKINFNNKDTTDYTYNIEISNDGEEFTTVVNDATSNTDDATVSDFSTEKARYVRVSITDVTEGRWASIIETEVYNEVDVSELEAVITEGETKEELDYTILTWDRFTMAFTNAKRVLSNEKATQALVNKAKNELEIAMENLVIEDVDSKNLALNKSATASSEQTGEYGNNIAENANNDDPTTRWAAEDGNLPQWWQVDLESVQEINQVKINFNNKETTDYTYDIEISNDGEEFTTIVNEATSNTEDVTVEDFSTEEARYIRVSITDITEGSWASIIEVEVHNNLATEDLEVLIKKAEKVKSEDYTNETVTNLQEAIEESKTLLEESNLTQAEVDAQIEALQKAYDGLQEEDAGSDTEAADIAEVKRAIYNLPRASELTLKNKETVEEVRVMYDDLSEEAKALVTTIFQLEVREDRITELEDKRDGTQVKRGIYNLPRASELTLKDKEVVEEVRAIYDDLSEEAKALVTTISQLEAREDKLTELAN